MLPSTYLPEATTAFEQPGQSTEQTGTAMGGQAASRRSGHVEHYLSQGWPT